MNRVRLGGGRRDISARGENTRARFLLLHTRVDSQSFRSEFHSARRQNFRDILTREIDLRRVRGQDRDDLIYALLLHIVFERRETCSR